MIDLDSRDRYVRMKGEFFCMPTVRRPLGDGQRGVTIRGPGARVKSRKKHRSATKSTIYADPIFMSLARKDIDLAIDGLTYLNGLRVDPNDSLKEKFDYAQLLCKYTRYCHLTTWKFEISIERAETPVLEELQKAESIVDDLIKSNKWDQERLDLLKKIHRNVTARIYNLRERYCKGLNTLFDFEEAWPHKYVKKFRPEKAKA